MSQDFTLNLSLASVASSLSVAIRRPLEILYRKPAAATTVNYATASSHSSSGAIETFTQIAQESSVRSLFKGTYQRIRHYAPSQGFCFAFYEYFFDKLKPFKTGNNLFQYFSSLFLAGGAAGSITALFSHPNHIYRTIRINQTMISLPNELDAIKKPKFIDIVH